MAEKYLIDNENYELFSQITNFLNNATIKDSEYFEETETFESKLFAELLKDYYARELSNLNILNLRNLVDGYNKNVSQYLLKNSLEDLLGIEENENENSFINYLIKAASSAIDDFVVFDTSIDADELKQRLKQLLPLFVIYNVSLFVQHRDSKPTYALKDNGNRIDSDNILYDDLSSYLTKVFTDEIQPIYLKGIEFPEFPALEKSISTNSNSLTKSAIIREEKTSHFFINRGSEKFDIGDSVFYLQFIVSKDDSTHYLEDSFFTAKIPLFKAKSSKDHTSGLTLFKEVQWFIEPKFKSGLEGGYDIESFIKFSDPNLCNINHFTVMEGKKEVNTGATIEITEQLVDFTTLTNILKRAYYHFYTALNSTLGSNDAKTASVNNYVIFNGNSRNLMTFIADKTREFTRIAFIKELIFSLAYKKKYNTKKATASTQEVTWVDHHEQLAFFDLQMIPVKRSNDPTTVDSKLIDKFSSVLTKTDSLFVDDEQLEYFNYLVLYKELNPRYRDVLNTNKTELAWALMSDGKIPLVEGEVTTLFSQLEGFTVSKEIQTLLREHSDKSGMFFPTPKDYLFQSFYANPFRVRRAAESELIAFYQGDSFISDSFGRYSDERKNINKFLDIFQETRDYYYRVLLNKAFINEENYKAYEKFFISYVSIMRFIDSKIDSIHDSDNFDERDMENFMKSYGFAELADLPNFANKKDINRNLIKNFIPLSQLKGAKDVVKEIIKIFGIDDSELSVNKLMIYRELNDNLQSRTVTYRLSDNDIITEDYYKDLLKENPVLSVKKLLESLKNDSIDNIMASTSTLEIVYRIPKDSDLGGTTYETITESININSIIDDELFAKLFTYSNTGNDDGNKITSLVFKLKYSDASDVAPKIRFAEIDYTTNNDTDATINKSNYSLDYNQTIEEDPYWNPIDAPEEDILKTGIDLEASKYITASLSADIYRSFMKSRIALSAIDYFDEQLINPLVKDDTESDDYHLLNIRSVRLNDEDTLTNLGLPDFYNALKLLFQNVIKLYKVLLDHKRSNIYENSEGKEGFPIRATEIEGKLNENNEFETIINGKLDTITRTTKTLSDGTNIENIILFHDTEKRKTYYKKKANDSTWSFEPSKFYGINKTLFTDKGLIEQPTNEDYYYVYKKIFDYMPRGFKGAFFKGSAGSQEREENIAKTFANLFETTKRAIREDEKGNQTIETSTLFRFSPNKKEYSYTEVDGEKIQNELFWEKNSTQYTLFSSERSTEAKIIEDESFSDRAGGGDGSRLNSGKYLIQFLQGINRIALKGKDLVNYMLHEESASVSQFDYGLFYRTIIEPCLLFPEVYFDGLLSSGFKDPKFQNLYVSKEFKDICKFLADELYTTEIDPLIPDTKQASAIFEPGDPNRRANRFFIFEDIFEPIASGDDATNTDFTPESVAGFKYLKKELIYGELAELTKDDVTKNIENAISVVSQKLTDACLFMQEVLSSQEFLQFSFRLEEEQKAAVEYLQSVLKIFISYTSALNKVAYKEKIETLFGAPDYAELMKIIVNKITSEQVALDEELLSRLISYGGLEETIDTKLYKERIIRYVRTFITDQMDNYCNDYFDKKEMSITFNELIRGRYILPKIKDHVNKPLYENYTEDVTNNFKNFDIPTLLNFQKTEILKLCKDSSINSSKLYNEILKDFTDNGIAIKSSRVFIAPKEKLMTDSFNGNSGDFGALYIFTLAQDKKSYSIRQSDLQTVDGVTGRFLRDINGKIYRDEDTGEAIPVNFPEEVTLPAMRATLPVNIIDTAGFKDNGEIKEITIPSTYKTIGDEALSSASIEKIKIKPNYEMQFGTDVVIHDQAIEWYIDDEFDVHSMWCSFDFETPVLDNGKSNILGWSDVLGDGSEMSYVGNTQGIDMSRWPEGKTRIGKNVFKGFWNHSNYMDVYLTDALTEVGESAFEGSSARINGLLEIGGNLSKIGKKAFAQTVITDGITFSEENTIKVLEEGIFNGTDMPNGNPWTIIPVSYESAGSSFVAKSKSLNYNIDGKKQTFVIYSNNFTIESSDVFSSDVEKIYVPHNGLSGIYGQAAYAELSSKITEMSSDDGETLTVNFVTEPEEEIGEEGLKILTLK